MNNAPATSVIQGHRLEIEPLDVHRTHGAKQQGLRQHQEHQVRQVAHALATDQPRLAGNDADRDQQHHRQQRGQDGVVEGHGPLIIGGPAAQ
jgi:hypothetical protein